MSATIRRRRLHYFSGFDPRGPAHYHRLCREEAAKPQPHGGVIQVGRREKVSPTVSRWQVEWKANEGSSETVRTEHVFMSWDDIIRTNWCRTPWGMAVEFVATYAHIFRHIGAARVWRMYRPAFKAGAFPLVVIFAPLLIAALLAGVFGPLGGAGGLLLAALAWSLAAKAGLLWVLRIYTFFMRMGKGPVPGLDARAREWVESIISSQQADPVDEVLLVGHSVGTLVMVEVIDALQRDDHWKTLRQGRPTNVLTLGHSYPMVAMAPGAGQLRDSLGRLSQDPELCWWDVTARIDPLCFYNLHPLAESGVAHHGARWPVMHTARFMHMYEPARWARIRRNKLQAHFLYLATPDKPGNFSPFDVFYGPRSLAEQMDAGGAPAVAPVSPDSVAAGSARVEAPSSSVAA